jgi:hypothetical protein
MTPQQANDYPSVVETPTLESVIARIEAEFSGWTWLVRNDEHHGHFANLVNRADRDQFYPTYAIDKVAALGGALHRAQRDIGRMANVFYVDPQTVLDGDPNCTPANFDFSDDED